MPRRWILFVVGALVLVAVPAIDTAAQSVECVRSTMPYRGIPGAALTATDHVSLDRPPVRYTRWRGTVPGFDGLPFSVDVTVPCGTSGRQPTVVMVHGFNDDKTVWQETGKGDRVVSRDRPQTNSHWNNIWFASRGYTVVNYTARGWHDSCGPDAPGATRLTPAPQCLPFEYWIHLDDKRWEVRDAQWLAGALVQSGLADAGRLAITGGSYGGAPTAMAGLLAGWTMCGGAAVPPALGADPCAGRGNGELVPWTTPDGRTPLTWVASVPLYTFGDVIQVLAPNGRGTDGWSVAGPDGNHIEPFGVPVESTVAGLLASATVNAFLAPPGLDPDADIVTDTARLLAGNPFPEADPFVARADSVYRRFKSPITTPPGGRVPIFWVQGLTDPLFTAFEALQILNLARAADTTYPMKLFLGDFGHDYTGQRQDEWDHVRVQMNDFLDHFLRPDRTPSPPTYDIGATVTRCLDHDAPMRVVNAPGWHDLHPTHATFTSDEPGVTSSALPGPAGFASDPVTTASLPLPTRYLGCRIMRPSEADPTVATYEFPLTDDTVLMGGPVVDLSFTTTGPDTELNVRVWDVAADRSAQGLVTRGTYRSVDPPGPQRVRFQLAPQGYRFPAGHRIKVEVTGNDLPYLQASNLPALVQVERLELLVPLLAEDATVAPGPVTGPVRLTLPATGHDEPTAGPLLAALGLLGLWCARLRRRRPPARMETRHGPAA